MDDSQDSQWWCKVAGQMLGPMTTEQLISLVNRRKLFADELVRLGKDGDWMLAGNIEGLFDSDETAAPSTHSESKPRLASASPSSRRGSRNASNAAADALGQRHRRQFEADGAAVQPPGLFGAMFAPVTSLFGAGKDRIILAWEFVADKFELFRERILQSKIALAVIAVALLALVLNALQIRWKSEPDPYSTYVALWVELRELRNAKADEATWNEFAASSNRQLTPIVKRLEKNANTKDQASMALVWAGRDHFPKMLYDARKEVSESERMFERRMSEARYHLVEAQRQAGSSSDIVTYLILAFDVCLVAGVAFFVFNNRR